MTALDQAWEWYAAARSTLRVAERLGEKFWDALPWDDRMLRDALIGKLQAGELAGMARHAQEALGDSAVVLMFSAFEGLVREHTAEQVRVAAAALTHPVLISAGKEAIRSANRGPLWRVLDAYAKGGHAGATEQVRQIRKYRNWVSHGRRGKPQPALDPKTVYDQLKAFLHLIVPPPPAVAGGP